MSGAAMGAMGLSMFGGMVQAEGAKRTAKAQATVFDYNASVADRNAGISREQASRDAASQQRLSRQVIGAGRAAYGASGITTEGSAMDVLQSGAELAELDRLNILYKGDLKALGYSDQSKIDTYASNNAIEQGHFASAAGYISGASGAMSSAGGYAG